MKHVGKMKNNGARVVIAYRTLPGDPLSALVIGTSGLGASYHDALMSVIESDSGQQSNEISDVLAIRKFPDGNNMLAWLHTNGHLKKVATKGVEVLPDRHTTISLDELNLLIAEQKGLTLAELADGKDNGVTEETVATTSDPSNDAEVVESDPNSFELTPAEMRSRADALYKEAARLRKQADDLDPPKKKTVAKKVKEAEDA